MTASPLASPLMTPDLRHRLQKNYEQAQRLSASKSPDHARIHELLAECLRHDPGNVLYLDTLFANVRQRQRRLGFRASQWLNWLVRTIFGITGATRETDDALLRRAPEILSENPLDPAHLSQLAQAAAACELDQAELRYWELAAQTAPENAEILRGLTEALTWQGHFADASAAWRRLLSLSPQDAATVQALTDLEPVGHHASHFGDAERVLIEAQAAGAPLLEILASREQLQIDRSEQRLAIAERRAAHDQHQRAQALVARLQAEHNHVAAEILHLRCERLPDDWQTRVALARALKRSGNFSGAIQRLDEALRLRSADPTVLLELGECWQHLRQFPKALDFFRQAIVQAERENDATASETLPLARYRAAVLAEALGHRTEAHAYLTALIAGNPSYKDARQRLDNLGSN